MISARFLVIRGAAIAVVAACASTVSAEPAGQLKMEDEFFIKLCKKNPAASGCVTRVQKCRASQGSWAGYEKVLCSRLLQEVPAVKRAAPAPSSKPQASGSQKYNQQVDLGGSQDAPGLTTPTPGRRTPVRKPKKKLTAAQLLKIVEIVCPKKPNVKLCRQFRGMCYSNW